MIKKTNLMTKWSGIVLSAALVLTSVLTPSAVTKVQAADVSSEYSQKATELSLNGAWSSDCYITDTDTEDWYRLNVPSDGKVILRCMSYMRYLNFDFYTDQLITQLEDKYSFWGTDTAPKTEEWTEYLSAGTYYLHISQNGDNTGRYRIYAGFESYNANDAGADSVDKPFSLAQNTTITGGLTRSDKEDWYKFTVPANGAYNVKLVSYMNSLDYVLYNSDLSKKLDDSWYRGGTETQPATKIYNYTLSPGNYYIKLSCGDYGKYTIGWAALTPENCSHEYEAVVTAPTFTQKGYTTYTCKICGNQYKDQYTAKLKLSQGSLNVLYGKKKAILAYYYAVGSADGYQFRYSTDKKFKKGVKKVKKSGAYGGYKKLTKLKSRKKYYVQVRAYKVENGKTVYGAWSSKKAKKTK